MLYIVLFICTLITPLSMVAVGIWWTVKPPKMDHGLGYRTALSSRSQKTWEFAHHHISRLWIRLGVILGAISAVVMVLFKESHQSFVLWIIGAQMLFLCISAFLVDTALKNGFDESGNPVKK